MIVNWKLNEFPARLLLRRLNSTIGFYSEFRIVSCNRKYADPVSCLQRTKRAVSLVGMHFLCALKATTVEARKMCKELFKRSSSKQ